MGGKDLEDAEKPTKIICSFERNKARSRLPVSRLELCWRGNNYKGEDKENYLEGSSHRGRVPSGPGGSDDGEESQA